MAKPMPPHVFKQYLSIVDWKLVKGSIDWKLYDENEMFLCAIKISHGNTKQEVVASSVRKVEKKI